MPPSARNPQRELHVKALNKIAASIDLLRIANNAGKPRVEGLIQAVRDHVDCNGWTSAADEDVLEEAVAHKVRTMSVEGCKGFSLTGLAQGPL